MTIGSLLTEFFGSRGAREYVGRHRKTDRQETDHQRYVAVAAVRKPSPGSGAEPEPARDDD